MKHSDLRAAVVMHMPLFVSALVMAIFFVAISLLAPEPIPDTQFGADAGRIAAILSKLADDGLLDAYRRMLIVDFFFPLAYTSFFVLALRSVYYRSLQRPDLFRLLSAFAVAACVLDYAENIAVLMALRSLPNTHPVLAVIGPVTTAKWIAVGGTLVSLVIGVGIVAYRRVRKVRH